MATRTLLFFMRPVEFWKIFWDVIDNQQLTVILRRYGIDGGVEVGELPGASTMANGAEVHKVYVAYERPNAFMLQSRDLRPAAWGWLSCDVPREVSNVLFLAQMSARSDWWDEESGTVLVNPVSVQIFWKVARAFRNRLKRPVWARNVVLGGQAGLHRRIGYGESVIDWVRQGGELASVGAAWEEPSNVRFFIQRHD